MVDLLSHLFDIMMVIQLFYPATLVLTNYILVTYAISFVTLNIAKRASGMVHTELYIFRLKPHVKKMV